MKRSRRNPVRTRAASGPSDVEIVVGGVAAVVLAGFGAYLVYSALNPPGTAPDSATTLEEASSVATLAALAV